MASTILYKFRSGTTFEALPLPGSAARLFDVKKAIVKAKKLDSGSMEFDLGVRNADTNEEYSNEGMLLPRGTRLIVQRLPAQRGHGFLARMARNEQAGTGMAPQQQHPGNAPNGYYTIESRAGDDDEFVDAPANEEKELAALQAATNLQSDGPAMTGGYAAPSRSNFPAGAGQGGPPKRNNFHQPQQFRPNADPELREQEKKMMPKKARTTGIPRTFQSLQAPPPTEGAEGEETAVSVLQPNSQGFKDLVSRGGGQSANTAGTRHDLDYALKLTASTVPDYLLCAICNKALRKATLLPWDTEGRSTCESCIRDALTQNGFRCPLTGMEGVSPDDLLPNIGLRKAVDVFIKGVMEKVDEVEQQRVEEDENFGETIASSGINGDILEGDGIEKGVIVSRKSSIVHRKKFEEDDPFADDDDFGGDVFAVDVDKPDDEETEEKKEEIKEIDAAKDQPAGQVENKNATESKEADNNRVDKDETTKNPNSRSDPSTSGIAEDASTSDANVGDNNSSSTRAKQAEAPPPPKRRRRGPPAGYTMGPAGFNAGDRRGGRHQDGGGYRGRGGGGHRGGRSNNDSNNRGGGGRYNQSHDGDGNDHGQDNDRNERARKRTYSDDHSDGHRDKQARHDRYDDRDSRHKRSEGHDDRNNYRNEGGRSEGGGRGYHRGGYRGGRGGGGRSFGRGGGGGGYRGRRY